MKISHTRASAKDQVFVFCSLPLFFLLPLLSSATTSLKNLQTLLCLSERTKYLSIYLPYLPTYIHTYLPTYLPTYIPTYLPTYLPTLKYQSDTKMRRFNTKLFFLFFFNSKYPRSDSQSINRFINYFLINPIRTSPLSVCLFLLPKVR